MQRTLGPGKPAANTLGTADTGSFPCSGPRGSARALAAAWATVTSNAAAHQSARNPRPLGSGPSRGRIGKRTRSDRDPLTPKAIRKPSAGPLRVGSDSAWNAVPSISLFTISIAFEQCTAAPLHVCVIGLRRLLALVVQYPVPLTHMRRVWSAASNSVAPPRVSS